MEAIWLLGAVSGRSWGLLEGCPPARRGRRGWKRNLPKPLTPSGLLGFGATSAAVLASKSPLAFGGGAAAVASQPRGACDAAAFRRSHGSASRALAAGGRSAASLQFLPAWLVQEGCGLQKEARPWRGQNVGSARQQTRVSAGHETQPAAAVDPRDQRVLQVHWHAVHTWEFEGDIKSQRPVAFPARAYDSTDRSRVRRHQHERIR